MDTDESMLVGTMNAMRVTTESLKWDHTKTESRLYFALRDNDILRRENETLRRNNKSLLEGNKFLVSDLANKKAELDNSRESMDKLEGELSALRQQLSDAKEAEIKLRVHFKEEMENLRNIVNGVFNELEDCEDETEFMLNCAEEAMNRKDATIIGMSDILADEFSQDCWKNRSTPSSDDFGDNVCPHMPTGFWKTMLMLAQRVHTPLPADFSDKLYPRMPTGFWDMMINTLKVTCVTHVTPDKHWTS